MTREAHAPFRERPGGAVPPGLLLEIARTMAAFCSETGIKILALDGLEGNYSTGLGDYGMARYAHSWYEALAPNVKGQVRNEASNAVASNWHINTHFSWGERHGHSRADRDQGYIDYRAAQQLCYARNFLPGNFGFYINEPDDKLEDIERTLARAAGYGAGFLLELSKFGNTWESDESLAGTTLLANLDAVHVWETARKARAFPDEIKPFLQDPDAYFHLEKEAEGQWRLHVRGPSGGEVPGNTIVIPVEKPLDQQALDTFE